MTAARRKLSTIPCSSAWRKSNRSEGARAGRIHHQRTQLLGELGAGPARRIICPGEDLHVAIWPGGLRNSQNITQFIAKETRSFVMSVSDLMRRGDIPVDLPHLAKILADCPEIPANGGTCLPGPEEEWIIPPVVDREELAVAALENRRVREERQKFDPAGHYAQPDVAQLTVNRERQLTVIYEE